MFCGKCGQRLKQPEETKEPQPEKASNEIELERKTETKTVKQKSVGIGILLNFIITGLGLVYTAEYAMGVFFILVEMIVSALMLTYPEFMISGLMIWVVAFIASSYLSYISIVDFNKKSKEE